LAALAIVRKQPGAAQRGAIWISDRVARLYEVAGFCGVEEQRLADAEAALRAGLSVRPAAVGMRSELSFVLTATRRPQDALTVVEEAMELGPNRCESARLWRKKGYVLFDLGRLVESYAAYARSLELQPGYQPAMAEMKLIVSELRRTGTALPEKMVPAYEPPPQGKTVTTACPAE